MTCRAGHEELDDTLGLGGEMGSGVWGLGIRGERTGATEQAGQRNAAEAAAALPEELAA